ncbi:LysM peptidoglycan-binding domain-containing protein [Ruegeria arenilitoris]|uniref:LysM peptidoglycan-binding domain-containing protein n=1 Tax=Ruegeria arenilitoris TaxID=1173585 RepID=UPI001479AFC9|nr:LysM peptidoglycan-binding domain-containing protein [Ruegeria arenilitoris]
MNAESGSGSSKTFIWGLVAGLVAVLVAGGLYLSGIFNRTPTQSPTETDVAVEQPSEELQTDEPAASTEDIQAEALEQNVGTDQSADISEPAVESESEDPATDEIATAAPVLDQIFVEPDGNSLLSGTADPGSEVDVVLDGETVHSFTVDETGQFAEFLSIPFDDDARGLVLETQNEDEPVRSDDYLIAALPEPGPELTDNAPQETEDPETAGLEASDAESPDPKIEELEEPQTESSETATSVAETETDEEPAAITPTTNPDKPSQQVAILRSGEDGVELVKPPAASETPPDQVELDTIGYSDEGEVELTGRVQDDSSVRLYLDNNLVADLDPSNDGQWRGEIEGVDPGVYTLRVDEVSPEGDVVSRIETPFQREPIETLKAAEAAANPNSSTAAPIRSVTVQKGDTLWAISRERYGDGVLYVRLFDANRESIRDPDLIYPGQIFTIPE